MWEKLTQNRPLVIGLLVVALAFLGFMAWRSFGPPAAPPGATEVVEDVGANTPADAPQPETEDETGGVAATDTGEGPAIYSANAPATAGAPGAGGPAAQDDTGAPPPAEPGTATPPPAAPGSGG